MLSVHLKKLSSKVLWVFLQSFTSKVKTHFPILQRKKKSDFICTALLPKNLAANLATKQTSLKYFWVGQWKLGLTGLIFKPATTDHGHCILHKFFLQIPVLQLAPSRCLPSTCAELSTEINSCIQKKYTKNICKLGLETSKDYTWTCIKCKTAAIKLLLVLQNWKLS